MLKLNEIYCGDSENILKEIDNESIDLIVTSPPYDDLRHYNKSCENCWNKEKFEAIANELTRVLKDGGILIWNVDDKTENGGKSGTSMRQALYFMDECGLKLNDYMFWRKKNPMPQVKQPRYSKRIEFMFCFVKGNKPKTFNPLMIPCKSAGKHYTSTAKIIGGESGRRDLDYNVNSEMIDFHDWDIAVAQNRREFNVGGKNIKHPAVFPIELPMRHIMSWTNEGDIVLDPFIGSGTTAIAAIKGKRNFIGIELNEEYVEIANTLINEEFNKK